jgi:hypothetical protein
MIGRKEKPIHCQQDGHPYSVKLPTQYHPCKPPVLWVEAVQSVAASVRLLFAAYVLTIRDSQAVGKRKITLTKQVFSYSGAACAI